MQTWASMYIATCGTTVFNLGFESWGVGRHDNEAALGGGWGRGNLPHPARSTKAKAFWNLNEWK